MSDHFDKHLSRIKGEKGKKWTTQFQEEFTYFKLCHLMGMARDLSRLSVEEVSASTSIPIIVIERIEREEPGIPAGSVLI